MKRIRLDKFSSRLLSATPVRPASNSTRIRPTTRISPSTSPLQAPICCQRRWQNSASAASSVEHQDEPPEEPLPPLPSPPSGRARHSAKLAALHARLSLSSKIPLNTLARALIDPSADANPRFNNSNLAFMGATLIQYHASEYLIARWPRLPMAILFSAMKGFSGPPALRQVALAWGVEAAAAPGEEVDPGLLQFSEKKPTVFLGSWGYVRAEAKELIKYKWRRGMSSRVLYDDAFGELIPGQPKEGEEEEEPKDVGPEVSGARNTKDMVVMDAVENAHANFVRAVIGAIYLHCGRETAKTFIKAHLLSRTLDLGNMFRFKLPTRELARLCAREDFDAPVARILSETGRLSRTPVFVIGIYSGRDLLGEGVGASLAFARTAAAINALKKWYLYSPGEVGVPSDTFATDGDPWKPLYVDIGEIVN
ncbi:ribonuclease III [Hypoxylon sp. NC1633]|nr:ribonuclease III [Hypoxylon sp. NC1633]